MEMMKMTCGFYDLEENTEGFSIKDDKTADWAVKKIAEERAELERLKTLAEEQMQEIKDKVKYTEELTERKTSFLKSCLAQYFETVPHKETKTQSTYKLLSGQLVFKKPKQKLVKSDDDLIAYFKKNNMTEFVKIKEEPAWVEFKKNLEIVDDVVVNTMTGEVVEVVKIEEDAGSFEVKI